MQKIRVLVVDDSAFMRKVISDLLSADPQIEVIDRARNGLECLEKVKQLQPDVVTLDIEMPLLNGLETLKRLMEEHPVPVVMLSSLTKEGADATIQALEWGAFDFVTKPSGPISLDIHKVANGILEKVKAAAQSRPSRAIIHKQPKPLPKPPEQPRTNRLPEPAASGQRMSGTAGQKLVVMGTSTGGPKALQTVLTAIPAHFSAPILIVQHMPPGFTKSLAQRLDSLCAIRVVEAMDGQSVEAGTAYIAPGGYHLEVITHLGQLKVRLHQEDPRNGHRPSVDILFESASRLTSVSKWAIIMTGMGNDGTKGLQQMKASGHVTSIIEAESSCVVFGMPRAAIQAGLADKVVPLEQIADTLTMLVN